MERTELTTALQNPKCYRHTVKAIEVIETHISWVILTGEYAYKIKKPVNLGFVDFSTLEKRHYFCQEELRLNQTLASAIYLAIVPVTESYIMDGSGPIIEYAIQMKQFPQTALLSHQILHQTLAPFILQDIAQQIAKFHQTTESADPEDDFGSFNSTAQFALDNFTECRKHITDNSVLQQLNRLEDWTQTELKKQKSFFLKRKASGFIKSCHGDLHLGNIICLDDKITIFDRIDFNTAFRYIDVINEIAFLYMDLCSKHHKKEAFIFLNAYLELSGDYEGIALLSFYSVYRAMIRAKVALLDANHKNFNLFMAYLTLALEEAQKKSNPILIIMHGLSGSGKTHLTEKLIPLLPAIRIRSDVERKRLFKNREDLYSAEKTQLTFERLGFLAEQLLKAGFTVIVDAAFLSKIHRNRFLDIAKTMNIPFKILNCIVPKNIMETRINNRLQEKKDASDATIDVLNMQIKTAEPLTEEELKMAVSVETAQIVDIDAILKNLHYNTIF